MKKIEAIIRIADLDRVKDELSRAGVRSVIATEAMCVGGALGERHVYRGSAYVVNATVCARVSAFVADERIDVALELLRPLVEQGPALDGGLAVMNVEQVFSRAVDPVDTNGTQRGAPSPPPSPKREQRNRGALDSLRAAVALGASGVLRRQSSA